MEKMYNYLLNKVFTVPYIDKMVSDDEKPEAFIKCVQRHTSDDVCTYGEAISKVYHYMDTSYRNEYYYKNTILNKLLIEKHDLYNTAALTELPVAESKADFVMINGQGIVYEIKTELDNFNRLKTQLKDYYKGFEYVNVVVGSNNYADAKELLKDSSVGIYVLYNSGNLLCRKKAKRNSNYLSHDVIFRILRKKEFESIIRKYFSELPSVNNFKYYKECLKLLETLDVRVFQKEMLQCLKERSLVTVKECLEEDIPYELKFYAYFTKKYNTAHEMINMFWDRKLEV